MTVAVVIACVVIALLILGAVPLDQGVRRVNLQAQLRDCDDGVVLVSSYSVPTQANADQVMSSPDTYLRPCFGGVVEIKQYRNFGLLMSTPAGRDHFVVVRLRCPSGTDDPIRVVEISDLDFQQRSLKLPCPCRQDASTK